MCYHETLRERKYHQQPACLVIRPICAQTCHNDLQIAFKGAAEQMHGSNNDVKSRPDWTVPFTNGSSMRVINVFGTASANSITSIGFNMSNGRSFGPWGEGGGEPFRVAGLLLGFFGAPQVGAISGIGVWHMLEIPTSLEMSPAQRTFPRVWTWDDLPDTDGAEHLLQLPM
jgi:hypothetical protein